MSLSDQNYVSLSRKGSEANLVQSIVDRIGYHRNIPVCVVSKETPLKDKSHLFADKKSGNMIRFFGNKVPQEKPTVYVLYDSSKFNPGQSWQRFGRKLDVNFYEKFNPKYRIENEFFDSFPPSSPVEYVTAQKDTTVVRCVLIRKAGDPYPIKSKPTYSFVSEQIEEPEDRTTSVQLNQSDKRKPLRTYVLVRPEGYDEFEDLSIKKSI